MGKHLDAIKMKSKKLKWNGCLVKENTILQLSNFMKSIYTQVPAIVPYV
jgi:hypothetical protein